jgi:hypothetical protein
MERLTTQGLQLQTVVEKTDFIEMNDRWLLSAKDQKGCKKKQRQQDLESSQIQVFNH